jgi:cell division protein FtsI (penicillin-binding protein 3)
MPAFGSPIRAGGGFRPRVRLVVLLAALSSAFVLIAGRLVWVQGVDASHYVTLGNIQRQRTIPLPASRGEILDRNGNVLAMSVDARTIIADPHQIAEPQVEAAQLAPLLGVPAASLVHDLSNGTGFSYVARQIDPQTAARIMALNLPGITDVDDPKREYPGGPLAAQVVGFVGAEGNGLEGLESRYDAALAGKAGKEEIQADPAGQEIVSAGSQVVPPVEGTNLRLTLDQDLQFESDAALAQAVQAYHAEGGSIVVLQPSTGDVLALANYPTFDPNDFTTATAEDMTDRAVSYVYEPGSTNKVITASAALESGAVTTETVVSVPDTLKVAGSTFHDAEYHSTLDLTLPQILEQSSNVGTIKIALRVGAPTLDKYLLKFGYGQPTGIGLPGESPGLLPRLANWSGTTLPTAAIGQGVAVTVLQMASVYATIANGGVWEQPKIVAAEGNGSGQLKPVASAPPHRVIQAQTAKAITQMLLQVINGSTGTGAEAAIPGYQVVGKTGTAERPVNGGYSGYVASFMGFAPAQDPQLVVGVVLDQPTPIWGADTAAPTFKTVMQFALQRLGIGPGPVSPATPASGGTPLPAPARSGDAPAYPLPNPTALPVAPGATD